MSIIFKKNWDKELKKLLRKNKKKFQLEPKLAKDNLMEAFKAAELKFKNEHILDLLKKVNEKEHVALDIEKARFEILTTHKEETVLRMSGKDRWGYVYHIFIINTAIKNITIFKIRYKNRQEVTPN